MATPEPWTITRQEAIERHNRRLGRPVGLRDPGTDAIAAGHKLIVTSAIRAGKTVPPDVLKDYPDLEGGREGANGQV